MDWGPDEIINIKSNFDIDVALSYIFESSHIKYIFMNIDQLRLTIKQARIREGVNWYLTDRTPDIITPGQVFTLYGYNDDDELVVEIPFIEDRLNGQIDPKTIARIEAARADCGMNSSFSRKTRVSKEQLPNKRDEYIRCRLNWFHNPKFKNSSD